MTNVPGLTSVSGSAELHPGMVILATGRQWSDADTSIGVVVEADTERCRLQLPSPVGGGSWREVWLPLAGAITVDLQITRDELVCEYAIGGRLHFAAHHRDLPELELPELISPMTDQDALLRIFGHGYGSGGPTVNSSAARAQLKPEYILKYLLDTASGVRPLNKPIEFWLFEHLLMELPSERQDTLTEIAACATGFYRLLQTLKRVTDTKTVLGLVEKKLDEGVITDSNHCLYALMFLRDRKFDGRLPPALIRRLANPLDLNEIAQCMPLGVDEELYKELLLKNPIGDMTQACARGLIAQVTDSAWLTTLPGKRQLAHDHHIAHAVAKRLVELDIIPEV